MSRSSKAMVTPWAAWSPSMRPPRRVPRLALTDDLLHVGGEVRIEHRRAAGFLLVGFRQRDALGDRAACWSGRADHGERLRVALDDDFGAGLNTFQDGGKVAHRFGFADMQRLHH